MADDVETLLRRFRRAKEAKSLWDDQLEKAYRLAAPNVDTGFQSATQGEDKSNDRYDDTLMVAARDRARMLHSTITPPHIRFFGLRPGPQTEAVLRRQGGESAVKQAQQALDDITDLVFDELNASNFHAAVASAFRGEAVSTGVLRFVEDDRPSADSAFRFEAIPLWDVSFEAHPAGGIGTVWYERKVPLEHLELLWPDIEMPQELRQRLTTQQEAGEECIVEGTVYEGKRGDWRHVVLHEPTKSLMVEHRLANSDWITFASDSAPGELIGRGPVLDVLADGKTVDRAVQQVLTNGDIATLGVWQYADDGVINPARITLRGGEMIPHAPGSAGLRPLEYPGRFDISQLIIEDLRQRIRYAVFGPELPPLEARGMTATEVERRMHEANIIRVPEMLRLWRSLVIPLVRRALEILRRRGVVPEIDLGPRSLKIVATSPMARMQGMAEVLDAVNSFGLAAQVSGAQIQSLVSSERFGSWVLKRAGFPAECLMNEQERASMQAAMAEQAQGQEMAVGAEAIGKAAPALEAMKGGGSEMLARLFGQGVG